MKEYKPRIADKTLRRCLAGVGAVLIEGPKWCGKTTTAAQQAATVVNIDDPAHLKQNLSMADINPAMLLKGTAPCSSTSGNWHPSSGMLCAMRSTDVECPDSLY